MPNKPRPPETGEEPTLDPATETTLGYDGGPTLDPATGPTLDPDLSPESDTLPAADAPLQTAPSSGDWRFTPETPERYEDRHREIGRGGIGRVFLAFDHHLQRQIAVKELLRGTSAQSTLSERSPGEQRFVREAWITGQLEHPGVVPVYELGQRPDGTLYYTMQIVRGRTLSEALAEAREPAIRMALLSNVLDVCQAVAYAHSRGVIHRDLKPGNVMLGEFGETVVLDWGLAKVQGHDDIRVDADAVADALSRGELGTTIAGAPLGTPAYMSPEQASGDADAIDARSDVWSLGVLLFELLAGRLPFSGDTPRQVILALLDHPPPPLGEVAPDAPTDLAAIVDKALAPRRERYPNAGALARDLKAFLDGRRVSAYTYSSLELARRFVARNKALSAAIAALFLLSIAGTLIVSLAYRDAERARTLAERNRAQEVDARLREAQARSLAEERQRTSTRRLSKAYAERASQLLNEKRLLAARAFTAAALIHSGAHPLGDVARADALDSPESQAERARLSSLFDATDSAFELLRSVETEPTPTARLRFSPDGDTLVRATLDGRVDLLDADTLTTRRTLEHRPELLTDVTFSPDGRLLAYVGGLGFAVYLHDMEADETRRVELPARGLFSQLQTLRFSHDGHTLYIGGPALLEWDLRADTLARSTPVGSIIQAIALSPDRRTLALGGIAPDGGYIITLDAESHAVLNRWPAHDTFTSDLLFDGPDALISAGLDGATRRWSLSGEPDGALDTDASNSSIHRLPSGHILTNGRDLRLWSGDALLERLDPLGEGAEVIAQHGERVAVSGKRGDLHLWQVDPGRFATQLMGLGPPIELRHDPDGSRVAALHRDLKRAALWDLRSGERVDLLAPEGAVWADLYVGPRGLSALEVRGNQARLTALEEPDAEPRALPDILDPSPLPIRALFHLSHCNDRAQCLFTAAEFGTLYAPPPPEPPERLLTITNSTTVHAVSSSGELLAHADAAGRVSTWDSETRRLRWRRRPTTRTLHALAVSRDDTLVAAAGSDGHVYVMDARDGTLLHDLVGHENTVQGLDFSDDGALLASTGDDARVILWEPREGRRIQTLFRHTPSHAIAFAPDTHRLAIGEPHGVSWHTPEGSIWSLPPKPILARAEAALGLTLDGFELVPTEPDEAPAPPEAQSPRDGLGRLLALSTTNNHAPLPSDARVQAIHPETGAPLSASLERGARGELRVAFPDDTDAIGLRIEQRGHVTTLLSPWLRPGVRDWDLEVLAPSIPRVLSTQAGLPPPSPEHAFIFGYLLRGPRDAPWKSEPVSCATVTTPDTETFYALRADKPSESTRINGLFIIPRVPAESARVLTARIDDDTLTFTLPPLPAGSAAVVTLLSDSSEPPPRDCAAP